jgi:hypothetical protein
MAHDFVAGPKSQPRSTARFAVETQFTRGSNKMMAAHDRMATPRLATLRMLLVHRCCAGGSAGWAPTECAGKTGECRGATSASRGRYSEENMEGAASPFRRRQYGHRSGAGTVGGL